jgi:glycosyltransferase involved in cell wall biosynthesis
LIKNYKIKSEKILVTYEASEKGNDVKKQNRNLNSEKLHIGVVAGFYPHKGHIKVLEMAHKFIKSGFTNFKISFKGNPAFPNYIQEILSLKEQLRLNGHIFFVSFEPKIKLNEIYSNFDLIMLLSEYEGFGLPVLEAQAHYLPVFCSDIPIFREILNNSAYYIGNNPDNISIENIIADFKNKDLLYSLSLLGVSNLKKYSWEKMSIETIRLYKKIIKN